MMLTLVWPDFNPIKPSSFVSCFSSPLIYRSHGLLAYFISFLAAQMTFPFTYLFHKMHNSVMSGWFSSLSNDSDSPRICFPLLSGYGH